MTIINESGLYSLILSSKLEQVKTVQRIVNTTVDGRLGPKTLAAINVNDPRQLHLRVTFERLKFLESIARKPGQLGFLEGWKNRVAYLTYE